MNLPSDWYGVAGILIINVGIWMQSRRNVVGQINRRTELMETYFENLHNQQDIAGLRGDVRLLSSRVEKLEARDRHHHPDVQP